MSLEVVILWQIQGCKHPSYVPELTAEKSCYSGILLETLGEDSGEEAAAEEEEEVCGCVVKALLPHCPPTWPWGLQHHRFPAKPQPGCGKPSLWTWDPVALRAPLFMGLFPMWFPADQRLAQGKAAWLPVQPWTAARAVGWDAWAPALCKKWRGEKSQVLRMKVHVKVRQTLLPTTTAGLGLGYEPWGAVWELGWALLAVGAVAVLPGDTTLLKPHLWNETHCSIQISQNISGSDIVWHRILWWP